MSKRCRRERILQVLYNALKSRSKGLDAFALVAYVGEEGGNGMSLSDQLENMCREGLIKVTGKMNKRWSIRANGFLELKRLKGLREAPVVPAVIKNMTVEHDVDGIGVYPVDETMNTCKIIPEGFYNACVMKPKPRNEDLEYKVLQFLRDDLRSNTVLTISMLARSIDEWVDATTLVLQALEEAGEVRYCNRAGWMLTPSGFCRLHGLKRASHE